MSLHSFLLRCSSAVIFALFFGSLTTEVVNAQGQQRPIQQTNNTVRLPRPTAPNKQAAKQVKLDPELDLILRNWEKAGDFTKKMEGKHYRYMFDNVFQVQKISQGEFYYEAPDKGRLDLEIPKGVKEGQQVKRNGKIYTLKKDGGERWICDGTQVFAINEERKEFQRIAIPVESRGNNIVDGPLPFLFGISKEKVIMRYSVSLYKPEQGGKHNYQAGIIHLKVKPNWQQDAANWQEAEVMLNAKDYLPTAIRLIHPGNKRETVYVFTDVKRNAGKRLVGYIWGSNPFAPSLRGYKEMMPASPTPNAQLPKK